METLAPQMAWMRSLSAAQMFSLAAQAYVALLLVRTLGRLLFSASYRAQVLGGVLRVARRMPGAAGAVAREQEQILADIESNVAGKDDVTRRVPAFARLPSKGLSLEQISEIMTVLKSGETLFANRKAFGGIYYEDGDKLYKAGMLAYTHYSATNALYPTLFPGLRKFEAEVVSMSAAIMCGDENVCGTMTSGGTESVILAMKTMRDRAAALFGITAPEVVIAVTAHPAANKGAHMLGIKLVTVPVDETYRADMRAFAAALNANTIMAIGSAPGFPHGIMDRIGEMAALCHSRNIGFHVDCCLGSFLVPWLKRMGKLEENFDFSLPGVTSMSADLHKYGYAQKGASVVLYRNKALRKYQYFSATSWPGGLYCSPSFCGSRSGGLIAAAWAALVANGEDGFMRLSRAIHETFERTLHLIRSCPDLYVLGSPAACVIAFSSRTISIFQLADELSTRGWDFARLMMPDCLHWAIGERQVGLEEAMARDLAECIAACKRHPERAKTGMAGIYGMAGSLPDRTIVDDLLTGYMDVLLKVPASQAK